MHNKSNVQTNPFEAGYTLVCCWILENVKYIDLHVVRM